MAKGNLDETEKTNTITTKAGKLTTVGSIINKLNSLFRTQIYLVKVLLNMSVVKLDLLHKKQVLKIIWTEVQKKGLKILLIMIQKVISFHAGEVLGGGGGFFQFYSDEIWPNFCSFFWKINWNFWIFWLN